MDVVLIVPPSVPDVVAKKALTGALDDLLTFGCKTINQYADLTVEPPNKGHFASLGVGLLSFVWRLSSG